MKQTIKYVYYNMLMGVNKINEKIDIQIVTILQTEKRTAYPQPHGHFMKKYRAARVQWLK